MIEPRTPTRRRYYACLLYEILVNFAIFLIGYWLPHTVLAATGTWIAPGRFLLVHVIFLFIFYNTYFWVKSGQTLAMKTWRLRVVDEKTRRPPRLSQAVLRACLAWASVAWIFLGFLWPLIDKKRRAWHDIFAHTEVVWEKEVVEKPAEKTTPPESEKS